MELGIDHSKISDEYYIEIDESAIQGDNVEENNILNYQNELQTKIHNTDILPRIFNRISTKSIYLDEISVSLQKNDKFSNINNNRIELLVRKYCNEKFEVEENARLKLLSKKLKKYFPIVEEHEYKILDSIINETNRIKIRNEKRKKKYKIK